MYKDFVSLDGLSRCYGKQDEPLQQIEISDHFCVERQRITLLHELIHAISDYRDLELSEVQVSGLADELILLERQNRGLLTKKVFQIKSK